MRRLERVVMGLLTRFFVPETAEEAQARVREEIRRENLRTIADLPAYRREVGVYSDHDLQLMRVHRIPPRRSA